MPGTKTKGATKPRSSAVKPRAVVPTAPTSASEAAQRLTAARMVRRTTIGTFARRRTPITELLNGPRWCGDVTPWSSSPPSADDIPSWVNGASGTPLRQRVRLRSTLALATAGGSLLSVSAYLFSVTR